MSCQNVYRSSYIDNATGSRGYWSDRDVNDQLILPNPFDDVKIKPNDLVSSHVINAAIGKLYDNLLYIISKSRTPQSTIPSKQGFTSIISSKQTGVPGLSAIKSYAASELSDTSLFQSSHVTNMSTGTFFSDDNIESPNNRGVVYVSDGQSTNICMLQDTLSGFITRDVSTSIDNYTNRQIPLSGIVKSTTAGDILYTAVSSDGVVFKHDVSGLIKNDSSYFDPSANTGGKILVDTIGSPGDSRESARFKNINTITCDDLHNLYIVDAHELVVVKKFDKNSNFIESYDITQYLNDQPVRDICFTNNKFFVLTDQSVIEFTLKFVFLSIVSLTDQLLPGEQYKYVEPSVESRNIIYIASNKRVFKKFITRIEGSIGVFKFTNRDMHVDTDVMDVSFISVTKDTDGDVVYVGDTSRSVIFQFNESVDYQQAMSDGYQDTFLPIQSILIKPEEYVNYIVYNKMIAKLFFNHASVGNSIIKR